MAGVRVETPEDESGTNLKAAMAIHELLGQPENEDSGTHHSTIDLTVGVEGEIATVQLRGELDAMSCPKVRLVTNAALAVGATSLRLECADLDFIDSSGLALISELAAHTSARGGAVIIANLSAVSRRVFDVTGMDAIVVFSDGPPPATSTPPMALADPPRET